MFRTASFYFLGLLVLLVAGFWQTYFSLPPGDVLLSLHWHGIPMVLWALFLIVQPWLIRSGRVKWHRALGKASYALFPILVLAVTYVVIQDLGRNHPDPMSPGALGAYFIGYAHTGIMVLFYGLAIYHRKNVQLHARYMVSTALPMITPGLFRIVLNWIPADADVLEYFFLTMVSVGIVPIALIVADKIRGRIYPPFVYLAIAWAINLAGFKLAHNFDLWRSFTTWSLTLGI